MRHAVCGALVLVAAALTLLGCGNIGSDEVTARTEGPQLVTREQLAQHPEGSPARAFLQWWRDLQFDDAIAAARHYAKALDMSPAKLERQLRYGMTREGLAKRPRLVEVVQDGNRARVLVFLEKAAENPNGRVDTKRVPRAFHLIREDGRWKVSENLYLERLVRQARGFQRLFGRGVKRRQDEPQR
jgi:hypothetical protein